MPRNSQGLSYSRKTDYFRQVTHEFNTPAGWTCPWAYDCLTKVDRETGKRVETGVNYVCYAAASERFPSARESRWLNFERVKEILKEGDETFLLPKTCTHLRIHGSGDFFNQKYFDRWVATARANPDVQMWAFTKSIAYWVTHLEKHGPLPENFVMQASRGSKQDALIDQHGLKCAEVFHDLADIPEDMVVDFDDFWAQQGKHSFALLENFGNPGQPTREDVARHNVRALELLGLDNDGNLVASGAATL